MRRSTSGWRPHLALAREEAWQASLKTLDDSALAERRPINP